MNRRTAALTGLAVAATVTTALSAQAAPTGATAASFGATPGSSAAYHGTRLATQPKTAPANRAVAYRGPKLVLAQSYVGRKAAEPTLGVDRKGAIYTVASAFDAVPGAPKNEPRTLVEKSVDGGKTWQVAQPTVAGQNAQPVTTDPYLYVDPTYGRVFDVDLQGVNGAHMSYSDDGGKTYTNSALTTAGVNDHQTVVAGVVPAGSPLVTLDQAFPKIVYYCTNGIAYGSCTRSLDGGKTFVQGNQTGYQAVNPIDLATLNNDKNDGICGSLHGHAVTDPQGRLFVPRGYCNTPFIAISTDGATTFHDVKVSDITMSGQQASVASDKLGNLYYTWFDATNTLPYLAISKDHGEHWGTPMMIAPPGVKETNFPSLDVGDPGRIAVTFPGTTSTLGVKDKTRPWNSYVVVSTDALSSNPLFLSATANPRFDPIARGDCNDRCGRMYDFLDIVSAPSGQGRLFATAVDTCTDLMQCSTKRLPGNAQDADLVTEETAHPYGASADMQEVVIRQVSGPALRGAAPYLTK